MAVPAGDTPAPTPKPKTPKSPPSENNQKEADEIGTWQETLNVATDTTQTDLRAALADGGYDDAALAVGVTLVGAANTAYGGKSTAKGTKEQAIIDLHNALHDVHEVYAGFRTIARKACPGEAAATALGLHGPIAHDQEKFATQANASYAAAKLAPYTGPLSGRGFKPATLDTMIAALPASGTATGSKAKEKTAAGDAIKATGDRELALKNARRWMQEFTATAKFVCRNQPALLVKLGI
jgi:hypothetical protein